MFSLCELLYHEADIEVDFSHLMFTFLQLMQLNVFKILSFGDINPCSSICRHTEGH